MGSPSKKEVRLERVGLLSCSALSRSPQSKLELSTQVSSNYDVQCDLNPQSAPKKVSSSPLRIREKINQLFSNKKVEKQDDETVQKGINDPTLQEEVDQQGTKLPHDYKNTGSYGCEINQGLGDLTKAKEENELKEILKLREVIKQQENEEREDTVHDCSSLYAEETYLNTLRNQEIISFQQEENYFGLTEGGRAADPPVSRLFLDLFPHEEELFYTERNWSKNPLNYALASVWNKWSVPQGSDETICADILEHISERLHLYEIIAQYKINFQNPIKPFDIHLFREGFLPDRDSEELINGGVIELELNYSKRKSYKLWKNFLRFVLDDCYVKFLDKKTYELRQHIVGLDFLLSNKIGVNETKADIVHLKFWIVPSSEDLGISKELVLDMCHLLSEGLPDNIGHRISNAIYLENKSLKSFRVFGEIDPSQEDFDETDEFASYDNLDNEEDISGALSD